ncbi:M48 family metallopeptidase [Candidatus Kaiserbacteria bacterium]|nr:M48 family metallopeptidase [Candidatus Kaiserbacteria bacterium]
MRYKLVFLLASLLFSGWSFANQSEFSSASWPKYETLVAQSILSRADRVEKLTGLKFDLDWSPKVKIQPNFGSNHDSLVSTYDADTQTVFVPLGFVLDVGMRYGDVFSVSSEAEMIKDPIFIKLADSVLGEILLDQASRRWFNHSFYGSSWLSEATGEMLLGLNIFAEGFRQYIETLDDDKVVSAFDFPESMSRSEGYSFVGVSRNGGLWLVKDIVNLYRERGLKWLLSNSFVPTDTLRRDAVFFRERALRELSQIDPDKLAQKKDEFDRLIKDVSLQLVLSDLVYTQVSGTIYSIPKNIIALTQRHWLPGGQMAYLVSVQPAFLLEAPEILFEHVVYHELCHIKRRDVIPTREVEDGTEQCVSNFVGQARYQTYLDTLLSWTPKDEDLKQARAEVLGNLGIWILVKDKEMSLTDYLTARYSKNN